MKFLVFVKICQIDYHHKTFAECDMIYLFVATIIFNNKEHFLGEQTFPSLCTVGILLVRFLCRGGIMGKLLQLRLC